MRIHVRTSFLIVSLSGALMAGCSSGGGAPGVGQTSGALAAVPAAGRAQSARAREAARPFSVPSCSTSGTYSFVGGLNGNVAGGYAAGVLSGVGNEACDYEAGIGTGTNNFVSSSGNSADYSFIGAGVANILTGNGYAAFIGGGHTNTLSGRYALLGAGFQGTESADYGVLGGGQYNNVSGEWGFVGGGDANTASGTGSTVPGGEYNIAAGYTSFAAGLHADAAQGGSFVWSDSSSSSTTKATVANEFVARTAGGVKFFSNSAMTTGVSLAAGGGSWGSLSDRAVKTNVVPISDGAILDRVLSLPISTWSYVSERGVRHVGPMAQDFYAAFGVGEDNKHITSIDEDGVALAAIKALNARLEQRDAALQHQVTLMKTQMVHLAAKLAAIH